MDDTAFDRLTRGVARHPSRRSLLRALIGLGGAALAGGRILPASPAAAECAGSGCACTDQADCAGGLICCGSICATSGVCGISCALLGDPCPSFCHPDSGCTGCCGGLCRADGTCGSVFHGGAGASCNTSDPVACEPPFFCCAVIGGSADEGVCQEHCDTGLNSLGTACTTDADCSQEYAQFGVSICADNTFGITTCCRGVGGICSSPSNPEENDWACCGALECHAGVCG
ncbi:MAG: hypothetical protein U0031_03660 [Thermomicrobiales bacterium]